MKVLRTDNGTEFKNTLVNKLLAEADIIRELTCVDTSHQNAVAERAIGVLFAMARTMLVDSALPAHFWGEALMSAVHIKNRMPSSSNANGISPYEARFGRVPDISYLRPFGVTAFVRIQKHITKVSPRALKGIFVGYGQTVSRQKGWRVFIVDTGKVVTTTDVRFELSVAISHLSISPGQIPGVQSHFLLGESGGVCALIRGCTLPPVVSAAATSFSVRGHSVWGTVFLTGSCSVPCHPCSVSVCPTRARVGGCVCTYCYEPAGQ